MATAKKKVLLTKEWLSELQAQLRELKEVKRLEVAEKLKEAISYGDLSENSEYEEARNEQAQIEIRIAELEEKLKDVELVDEKQSAKKQDKIIIGKFVTLISLDGGGKKEEETYKIVGSTESDILDKKISNESPIGSALIGKVVWEKIVVKSNAGTKEYEIIKIQ